MACVPGMPCYSINTITFPKKCNNGWFAGYPILTNLISYNGANLPSTGVNTGDNLNSILQKIDNALLAEALASSVLAIIQTNSQYNEQFCDLVQACITPAP